MLGSSAALATARPAVRLLGPLLGGGQLGPLAQRQLRSPGARPASAAAADRGSRRPPRPACPAGSSRASTSAARATLDPGARAAADPAGRCPGPRSGAGRRPAPAPRPSPGSAPGCSWASTWATLLRGHLGQRLGLQQPQVGLGRPLGGVQPGPQPVRPGGVQAGPLQADQPVQRPAARRCGWARVTVTWEVTWSRTRSAGALRHRMHHAASRRLGHEHHVQRLVPVLDVALDPQHRKPLGARRR